MSIERGRVALVTGSTSGIGREMARTLAGAGARVVITGRDEERGSEVVGDITGAGGQAVFVAHDLEESDTTRLVEGAEGAFGWRVDILVNNGGTLMAAPTGEVDAETIDWAFRLNVRSTFLMTGALAPGMAERGWGRIINISSVSGQRGGFRRPGLALYGATKAALAQLTRAWVAEYGPYGVAVNCLAPAITRSPFADKNLGLADADTRARVASTIPAGRVGVPEDVAAAALFLASEEVGYVQGVVLNVDGGSAIA
ncbi:MAG: SDR family oxidoreductase [Actinobacteria bacterium]|nr:SDR family oxidoreductase [Actinomycetota bacterium]